MSNIVKKYSSISEELKMLQNIKTRILEQLNLINKNIEEKKAELRRIQALASVDINLEKLVEEIKNVSGGKDINIHIQVLHISRNLDSLDKIEQANDFLNINGSNMAIDIKDSNCFSQIWYKNLHLFNSLDQIQNDGKTIFEHCLEDNLDLSFNSFGNENVVCHFDLEEVIKSKKDLVIGYANDKLLERAIYECIKKGNIENYELKHNHQKIKQ